MPARRECDERWRYRKTIKLPDGSKVRISGTPTLNTKVAAEAAEREHINRVISPSPAPIVRKEVPTFQKFVKEVWWPTYPASVNNRPTTCQEKEIHLRLHLMPSLAHHRLDAIRGEVVNRLMARLKDESKLGPKSIKNVMATLRKILVCAVEWEYLPAMPPLPRLKIPQPEWDYLTPEESEKVLAVALAGYGPPERAQGNVSSKPEARYPVLVSVAMPSAKETVRRLLDDLPDNASLEDIQYHIHVRDKIERGLRDVEAGRVVDQNEAKRRMANWLGE